MSAHEARASTLLFRILENGHVKPDVHEQVWFAEAKRLLETEPAVAASPTSADDVCPDCGRSRFPVDRCNPDEIDDDGECPYLTIARLRCKLEDLTVANMNMQAEFGHLEEGARILFADGTETFFGVNDERAARVQATSQWLEIEEARLAAKQAGK